MPSEPALMVVIRPPGRAPYVISLERLTQAVTMGRLANELNKARDAKQGLENEVIADVRSFVERVDYIRKRKNEAFMKQHAVLDADMSDIAEMEKDVEDFGKNDQSTDGGSAYNGTVPPKL